MLGFDSRALFNVVETNRTRARTVAAEVGAIRAVASNNQAQHVPAVDLCSCVSGRSVIRVDANGLGMRARRTADAAPASGRGRARSARGSRRGRESTWNASLRRMPALRDVCRTTRHRHLLGCLRSSMRASNTARPIARMIPRRL